MNLLYFCYFIRPEKIEFYLEVPSTGLLKVAPGGSGIIPMRPALFIFTAVPRTSTPVVSCGSNSGSWTTSPKIKGRIQH